MKTIIYNFYNIKTTQLYYKMSLPLKKFDMSTIKFPLDASGNPIQVLIGKRDTGRSWIQKDIKYYDENNTPK